MIRRTAIQEEILPIEIVKSTNNLHRPLIIMIVLSIFIIIPMLMIDMYFANDSSICYEKIFRDLHIWLNLSGYSCLLYILIVALGIVFCRNKQWFKTYKIIVHFYSIIWTIFSCILFSHFYNPTNLCDTIMSKYMWIRIILAFFNYFNILQFYRNTFG